jgi:hypothetical protein
LIYSHNLGYNLTVPRFIIEFNTSVKNDLIWIDKKHHHPIKVSIAEQLEYQPHIETRNRKPLDPSILEADWELRCREQNRYRVLYRFWFNENHDHENDSPQDDMVGTVLITAIGEKKGDQLWIGGQEQ